MNRAKHLVFFGIGILAGAGFAYLDFLGGRISVTFFSITVPLLVAGVVGFFYSGGMLVRDLWHCGDVPAGLAAGIVADGATQGADHEAATERFTYVFRPGYFSRDITYHLTEKSLAWTADADGEMRFSDIRRIRICEMPASLGRPVWRRCVITAESGQPRVLSSNHCVYFGFESQMPVYRPFVDELFRRVRSMNPAVEFWVGYSPAVQWTLIATLGVVTMIFAAVIAVPFFVWADPSGQDFWLMLLFSPIMFLVALVTLVPAWRSLRRNFRHRFDPRTENPLP